MKSPLDKKILKTRILIALFVIFLFFVLFVPSVINRKPQIQTKLLITALGIDEGKDGNVAVSAIAVMPQSGEQAMVKSITVESEEKTIGQCLETISELYGKETELGLCGLIVLGQSTQNKSVMPYLEFLLSSAFVSPGTYVVNSSNSSAKEILSIASELDQSSAQILSSTVDFNASTCNITTVTLLEFVSQHYSPSCASVIPTIQVDKETEKSAKQNTNGSQNNVESQSGDKDSKKTPVKSLKKTSLYKNGIKMGELDSEQTLGYNIAKNENMQGLIAVDNVVINGENLGEIICSIYSKKCKKRVEFVDDKPIIYYDVSITLNLLAQNKIIREWEKNGRDSNEVIEPVINAFEEKVTSIILSGIEKSKALSCDSFLIENAFYRFKCMEYKKVKKDTDNFFKDVDVKVRTKVSFK